jgi:hypothetical protein
MQVRAAEAREVRDALRALLQAQAAAAAGGGNTRAMSAADGTR